MNIGIKLRQLRTSKGLSRGDIEKRTGLLRCYLSRVENGHTVPNLETLEKLAGAHEVALYQLFFEGEGKPQGAPQKAPAPLDPEARSLVATLTALDKRDRKFVLAMVRKVAKDRRAAKRSS
ncbi:MAG TPA: helix-turn-helix transcriptional regulator [Terriglobia bacterium]|nr:helix-turn-helix transcriptional regulator [Terriglobia bacterium]